MPAPDCLPREACRDGAELRNWFDHILRHAHTQPEAPALAIPDRAITYGMLGAAIARCARRIAALDLPGDALVGVQIANPIRDLTLSLALFRIGMRSISLPAEYDGTDQLRCAAVLTESGALPLSTWTTRRVEVTDSWFEQNGGVQGALPASFSSGSQVCRLSLTSGSTGLPKVVEHTVDGLGRRMMEKLLICIGVDSNGVLCMPGLTANYGFNSACAALVCGRPVYFPQTPYEAARMIELFSADVAITSSEQLLALTRVTRKTGARVHSLRTVLTGGTVMTPLLLEAAMQHVCQHILCLYSSTETGTIAVADAHDVARDTTFAGFAWPGVDVGIFDDGGDHCPPGQIGLIKIRRSGDLSPSSDTAGWVALADSGWVAADGGLHLLGRAADVRPESVQQHQDVSPALLAEHQLRLDWDTGDAAAVLTDGASRSLPEIWIAVVDNRGATAEKLEAVMRPRGINNDIRIFSVAAIPRSVSGKVNRAQLKAMLQAAAAGRSQ